MYLVEKWQELFEKLIDFDDSKFDLNEFKMLFAESLRYLSEQNCECGIISLKAAEILGYIKAFQTFPFYPSGITKAEYEVCLKFAEGLFFSITHPEFYDKKTPSYGWIRVSSFDNRCLDTVIHIDNFDDVFKMFLTLYS